MPPPADQEPRERVPAGDEEHERASVPQAGPQTLSSARHPRGFRLLSRAAHAARQPSSPSDAMTLRLVLALWAAAIYAIYWLGYLRGGGS